MVIVCKINLNCEQIPIEKTASWLMWQFKIEADARDVPRNIF